MDISFFGCSYTQADGQAQKILSQLVGVAAFLTSGTTGVLDLIFGCAWDLKYETI